MINEQRVELMANARVSDKEGGERIQTQLSDLDAQCEYVNPEFCKVDTKDQVNKSNRMLNQIAEFFK
jgi:hypothetical protein